MTARSFRARLTAWNVAVLALVVTGLVAALLHQTNAQQDTDIDRELMARARFFEVFAFLLPLPGSNPPRPPAPVRPLPSTRPARRPPPAPVRLPAMPYDRETERFNWFRSPRFVDPLGRTMGAPGSTGPWDAAGAREALAGRVCYSVARSRGERVRVLSLPVRRQGRVAGIVQVAHELGDVDRLRADQLRVALALTPLALLVAAVGGLFLTNRALKPVSAVTDAAAQIGEEDLSRRLDVRGSDELARLAETFNQMIGRLEGAFKSRAEAFARLERAYEQQKRFTADASHELRTPLTRIKTTTSEALQQGETPAEYRQALEVADRAADTMARLIDELLLLARADAGQLAARREPVDLVEILTDASAGANTQVSLDLPREPVMVLGDEALLVRVFANLVENAARHTPSAGGITLSLRTEGDIARACVADTGSGIAAEHLPRLFERFYRVEGHRSRESGGTGLGLAICRGIVRAHDGDIRIESEVGKGTRVTVSLPVVVPPRC